MRTSGRLSWLFHSLIPERCALCLQPADAPVCGACRAELPWNRTACPRCALPQQTDSHLCADCAERAPPYDSGWSAFRYARPIDKAVLHLKYHAGFRSARWLGQEMAQILARRGQDLPELLLPVPLHPRRLRRRGYNQALELARSIGRCLELEVDADCAWRVRVTADQIGQNAAQRRRNVRNAFAVDAERVRGRHLALIDDVMTTGSTVAELARACRKAGAARIEVWTAARAV
jgi:ComF family protein